MTTSTSTASPRHRDGVDQRDLIESKLLAAVRQRGPGGHQMQFPKLATRYRAARERSELSELSKTWSRWRPNGGHANLDFQDAPSRHSPGNSEARSDATRFSRENHNHNAVANRWSAVFFIVTRASGAAIFRSNACWCSGYDSAELGCGVVAANERVSSAVMATDASYFDAT